MNQTVPSDQILERVASYYEKRLREHGATPAGVDWNSEASQLLRFQQLLRIMMPGERPGTLNDFGCGYGALADYLEARYPDWMYRGFDVSAEMIAAAEGRLPPGPNRAFTSDLRALPKATYTVASGIFNVKLETPVAAWHEYVLATLDMLASVSDAGFAVLYLVMFADRRERAWIQGTMIGTIAALVVSSLLVIHFLDHPFTQDGTYIPPDEMHTTLQLFMREIAGDPSVTFPCDPQGRPA